MHRRDDDDPHDGLLDEPLDSGAGVGRRHRRSTRVLALVLIVGLLVLYVLPQLAIGGRHHHFWIF